MNSPSTTSTLSVEESGEQLMARPENDARSYLQGIEYRTMKADKTVCHGSDLSGLPAGAKIIKVLHRYSYEQISSIVEHKYEVVRCKVVNGSIIAGYFPCAGEAEIINVVPRTHASSSFLAYLALNTPFYREQTRVMDEQMQVNHMTLTNWLEKDSKYVTELIKILKETCLDRESIANWMKPGVV